MLEDVFNRWNLRRIEECRTLIRWLDPRPGERILDVGCGDGFNDRAIAQRGARVIGIDLNERRLAAAGRRNRGPGARFVRMNAEELAFRPGSFDKAVSFCVIEHFRRDDRVLAHLRRVLKPGAPLILSADSLSNPEITERERQAHRRRYAVHTFYTPESLGARLAEAGFEVEGGRSILTTPFTLALVRLSWRLDDLPGTLVVPKAIGYLALGTIGKAASDLAERLAGRPDTGLTLLVRARSL